MNHLPSDSITEIYNFISDKDVKIYDTTLDMLDIINQYLEKKKGEQSFIVVDLGDVIRQFFKWKKNLPRITPYYAIKCNPCPIIIELLNKLGCCFDCASQQEILKTINLGIDPKNIIFANPCKPVDFIKFSRSNDVDLLVIDSSYELYKIKLYHPEASLLVRIQTDDSKSLCKFNCKFGVELDQVKEILELGKILNLNIIGVSFHVGSGCEDAHVYNIALHDCKKVFEIASSLDIHMNLIDIGGGFPGTDNAKVLFETMAEVINKSIDELFNDRNDITFIAEPGRYFVSSSHTIVCSIINKKEKIISKKEKIIKKEYDTIEQNEQKNNDNYINNQNKEALDKTIETTEKLITYYISDGVYKSFSNIIFDYGKPEFIPFNERTEKTYQSIIYGESCDSLDIISKNCQLPSLAIGESIIVKNMGAYTIASSTEFNGFTKAELFYIMT
jgi:ornithine decarboxylase